MKNSLILLSILGILTISCSSKTKQTPVSQWSGDNEEKINKYLDSVKTLTFPVAIFDWDNTVIKNDIGDAVMMWMVKHDQILRPLSWRKTSRWLKDSAVKNLERHCSHVARLEPLKTSTKRLCSDTILSIYFEGKAWKETYNKDTMEPAYAWLASLLAGYTPAKAQAIAGEAINSNLKSPLDSPSYIRVYPQMKKLIADLKQRGVDVWIVSASPQPAVEAFGKHVDIAPEKIIGIRNVLDKKGLLTSTIQGCGPYKDGNQDIITYRQGKRCWINKTIFNMTNTQDQMEQRSPISFAAGDSDTDAYFLKDASDLHIVINRNKPEVMCNALANRDAKWLINPMFIDPKSKRLAPYDCKVFGLEDQKE
jgi:phosphoserine phosphatase